MSVVKLGIIGIGFLVRVRVLVSFSVIAVEVEHYYSWCITVLRSHTGTQQAALFARPGPVI